MLAALATLSGAPQPACEARSASVSLRIVVFGDSDAAGNGDPTHLGWSKRYAQLLKTKRGIAATVQNLARDGQTSDQLLSSVRTDARTRAAIQNADIVLLGEGGADLNAGDSRWQEGKCQGRACYAADLAAFGRNFDATVALIRKLRGTQKTVLRAITLPNGLPGAEDVIPSFLRPVAKSIGLYQAERLEAAICGSVNRNGARCVDVLHAFNGPAGTRNAYASGLMNHADCC
jgi:lysophospholipase L1-like esterase